MTAVPHLPSVQYLVELSQTPAPRDHTSQHGSHACDKITQLLQGLQCVYVIVRCALVLGPITAKNMADVDMHDTGPGTTKDRKELTEAGVVIVGAQVAALSATHH